MKNVSKYKENEVGTVKIWKDTDTAKTAEQSMRSVQKTKPPKSSHVIWDIAEANPLFTNLTADSF